MVATLEELLVRIGADVSDLKKGLTTAEKGFDDLEKKVKKTSADSSSGVAGMASKVSGNLKAIAAGFLTATAAIALFTRAMSDTSALGRLATQSGIAVSELSALRTAAAEVGLEFQVVDAAIRGFTQRAAEGLVSALTPFSTALRSLGISARDSQGQVRGFLDILPEVADGFARHADGVTKAQVATALFGEEAGPKLIPLLNRGRQGLTEFIAEARRLGVVTDEQVRTADEYQAATSRMTESISALVREFAIRLAPAITTVANAITALLRLLPQAGQAESALADQQRDLITRIMEAEVAINRQVEALSTLSGVARTGAEARIAHAREELKFMHEQLESLRMLHRIELERAAVKPPERPSLPDQAGALRGAQEAMKQAQFELQQLEQRLSGQRLLFDGLNFQWMTHAEIVEQATARINQAYEHSGDRQRAVTQLKANLARQEQQQLLDTATLAASTLTSMFPQQKGAAIAAAVINTAVGITKALSTLLPPYSWIQAGLIAASGAAQIATIRSASLTGGSPPAVGGGGSTNSTAAATDQGSQPGRSLHIQGLDPAAIFSGIQVEELIRSINNEVQNGVNLISTRHLPI